jgi:hypothetical protein
MDEIVTNVLENVERVRAFVDALVPEMDCPACGVDDWVFVPGCAGVKTLLTQDGDASLSDDLDTTFNAIAWSCGNCGYIRFHHYRNRLRA